MKIVSAGRICIEQFANYAELARILGVDTSAAIILQHLRWSGFKKFLVAHCPLPRTIMIYDKDLLATNYTVVDNGTDDNPKVRIYRSDYIIIAAVKRKPKHLFARARNLINRAIESVECAEYAD